MSDPEKTPEEVIAEYREQQRIKGQKRTKVLAVVIGVFVLLGIIGSISDSGDSSSSNKWVTVPSVDTSWITGDFVQWGDGSNLAYSSGGVSDSSCGYGACLGITVATKNGCPNSLYAEIELLDKNDIKIGYSNDSIGSVSPASKAKLIFHLQDSELMQSKMWNVTKISCY